MYKFDFVFDGYRYKHQALAHADGFVDALRDSGASRASCEVEVGSKVSPMSDGGYGVVS